MSAQPRDDRRLLSAQLGIVVPADDVDALLAAEGPRFDRLAWTGRALLPVPAWRWLAGEGRTDLDALVGPDKVLTGVRATGLPDLLPEPARTDDRLVAVVAAALATAHRGAGWGGVLATGVRLVDLALRAPVLPRELPTATAEAAGRAALEAAATLLLAARHPEEPAEALQERRAALLDREADLLQVGRVLVVKGEQAAVEAALPLLR